MTAQEKRTDLLILSEQIRRSADWVGKVSLSECFREHEGAVDLKVRISSLFESVLNPGA